jgi:hypothetical protein
VAALAAIDPHELAYPRVVPVMQQHS